MVLDIMKISAIHAQGTASYYYYYTTIQTAGTNAGVAAGHGWREGGM